MALLTKWLSCLLFCASMCFFEAQACTIPAKLRGDWQLMDSSGSTVEANVTITNTGLSGVVFWDKSLQYDCFSQSGDHYVFMSETTDLFDLYNVNIYFCWYMQRQNNIIYRVIELTEQVLASLDERAKAYLTTYVPIADEVCEIGFDNTLPYKEMNKYFNP